MENFKRRQEKYESKTHGEHRYGIGKHFLKKKKIYLEDTLSKPLDTPPIMQEYLEKCKAEGLEINKLEFGLFQAKNGFQYEGFRATEDINPSDILIKVPKKLVLTTKICLFSDIQIIVKENQKFFTAQKGGLVEDHIMLVFLLRQYQLGKASPWYYLVNNLSRNIDTVDFWQDDEYKYLDDPVFRERIKLQRNYFNYIAKNLREILPKYPDLFEEQTYSEENIRWIYIHIWSRCFGGVMDYVSMVPIVEMMNHENTNMFFRIHKEGSEIEQIQITEEERANITSTDNESYQSEDNILTNEGEFDEFEEMKALVEPKIIKVDQSNPKLKEIKRHCIELEQNILNDFNLGDDVSIFFASKILEKIKKIELQGIQGKKKSNKLTEEINRLKQLCTFFTELLKSYYKQNIKDNVVINTSQKKIFENDVQEAEKSIQQMKKDNNNTNEIQESNETVQNNEEKVETDNNTKNDEQDQDQKNIDNTENNDNQQKEESKEEAEIKQVELKNNETTEVSTNDQEKDQKQNEAENKEDTQNKQNEEQQEKEQEESKEEEQQQENKTNETEKKEIIIQEKEVVVEQKLNDLELEYTDNPEDWKEMTYDNFILMADGSDKFQKGSQVYFCYNRLNNRSMLSKYGMALEYNKYDFVHIRYNYINDIVEYAPYTLGYIKYFELNKFKRFTISQQRFNTKIISFAKSMMWDLETQNVESIFNPTISIKLEIKGLQKVKQIYQEYLDSRMYKMEENEDMLVSKELNGHLYFAAIYRLERQRIIKNQLNIVNLVIFILEKMMESGEMGQSYFNQRTPFDEDLNEPELYHLNRYILRKYIKLFPQENKQF